MADSVYTLSSSWSSSARYTAGSETEVNLANPNDDTVISWITTASDSTPSDDVVTANKIPPYGDKAITLAAGTRLWIAGAKGFARVEE